MGLLLHDDVYVTLTESSVHIYTPHGASVVDDPSVFRWFESLRPLLDGTRSRAAVIGSFPGRPGAKVQQVLDLLSDARAVLDVGPNLPHSLSTAELAAYREEIDFIAWHRSSAARVFEEYRSEECLIIGTAELMTECVRACVTSGLRLVRAVCAERGCQADCAAVPVGDQSQRIECHSMDDTPEGAMSELFRTAGIVVQANHVSRPWRHHLRSGTTVVEAHHDGDEVWLGPAATHPVEIGRADVWSRRADVSDGWSALRGGPSKERGHRRAAAAVIAGRLVQSVFRHLTKSGTPRRDFTRVDLRTLVSTSHQVLAHPYEHPATPLRADTFMDEVDALAVGPRVAPEDLAQRTAVCFDPRVGVCARGIAGALSQPPVAVDEVRVFDAAGTGREVGGPRVIGYGFDSDSAQQASTLRALALYGALTVDPRRFVAGGGAAADVRAAVAAFRERRLRGCVWSVDLHRHRPVQVDALDVYLSQTRGRTQQPCGVAAGYDWNHAVESALLSHCRAIALSRMGEAGRRYPEVDLCEVTLGTKGARCHDIVRAVWPGRIRCYDLTAATVVPTYYFCAGDRGVACASGTSARAALDHGLLLVLARLQADAVGPSDYGPSDYGPPPVASLPRAARGPVSREGLPGTRHGVAELVTLFRREGWTPVAVPLGHDPAVNHVLPYVVRVVMLRD